MQTNNTILEYTRKNRCIDCSGGGEEVSHFGKTVNDNKNSIKMFGTRQLSDQIKGNILPRCFGRLKRHQSTKRTSMTRFGNLT